MSYTQNTATATCTITNVLDTNDLISNVYDYLTNHEDECPTELLNCESFQEFADCLEPYVELDNNILTIQLDTEESNNDLEIFDFLVDHYNKLMVDKFLKTTWVTYDSRAGLSAEVNYLDKEGNFINIEEILNAR